MMMTGKLACSAFARCSSSSPDSPGMRMSLTMTWGVSVSSAAIASCADENVLNAMSSRVSAFSNTQRIERSSSMIQTGFITSSSCRRRLVHRQQDGEYGVAGRALAMDDAGVLVHESLRQSKPEAAAALATRHQRMEDAFLQLLRDARTVVDDFDDKRMAVAPARERHLPQYAGPEPDFPSSRRAGRERLRRIARDIE